MGHRDAQSLGSEFQVFIGGALRRPNEEPQRGYYESISFFEPPPPRESRQKATLSFTDGQFLEANRLELWRRGSEPHGGRSLYFLGPATTLRDSSYKQRSAEEKAGRFT